MCSHLEGKVMSKLTSTIRNCDYCGEYPCAEDCIFFTNIWDADGEYEQDELCVPFGLDGIEESD